MAHSVMGGAARYAVRRLLLAVPVVIGTVTLLFAVFFVLPGDNVDRVLTGERFASPDVRAAVSERYGLDRPLIEQYGRFWQRLATGDLGESYVSGESVGDVIARTAPNSLRLTVWALVVQVVVAGVGAVVAVLARRRWIDGVLTALVVLLVAVPAFVLGHLLQLAFGVAPVRNGWSGLPVQGIGPDEWILGVFPTAQQLPYLILPVATVSAATTALLFRLLLRSLREHAESDVMRGLLAKGLSRRQATLRGLRITAGPAIAFVGVEFVGILGSAVITETVFSWPGLGLALARALPVSDAPVILGVTLLLAVVYLVVNLVTDLVHRALDPRVVLD